MPQTWSRLRLRDVLAEPLANGRSVPTADAGFPVLRLTALKEGRIDLSEQKIGAWSADEARPFNVQPGDILVSRGNGSLKLVGRAGLVDTVSAPVAFPDTLIRVRPNPTVVDSRFFVELWNASIVRDQIERAAKTTAGIFKVSQGDLSEIELVVPPLAQQRAVMEVLMSIQARSRRAREALDAIPPLLEKLRQSILAAAFRGDLTKEWRAQNPDVEPASELLERIRVERRAKWEEAELAKMVAKGKPPKDDRWKAKYDEPKPVDASGLPELPEAWCWASVEQLAADEPRSIQSGPFGSSLLHSEFTSEGILAIGIDNVKDGRFSMGAQHRISPQKFQELAKFAARPGDVLITVMATVGRCCSVPDNLEPAIITKHVYRVSPNRLVVAPDYLMNAMRGSTALRGAMNDDVRGQTRPGINGEVIRALPVPVAPRREQEAVLASLGHLLRRAEGLGSARLHADQRLTELDQGILSKAFRGELVEHDGDVDAHLSPGEGAAPGLKASTETERRGRRTHP